MFRGKRKSSIAMTVSVLGMAMAAPMVMPGTANAQSGSRLCGRLHTVTAESPIQGETIILLYEVPKVDKSWGGMVCETAQPTINPINTPFRNSMRQQDRRFWNGGYEFDFEVCEEFKTKYLGGRELNFNPTPIPDWWDPELHEPIGQFPDSKDQDDICNNMNRSDFIDEMQRYWLHDDDGQGSWEFYRD